MKAIYKKELRLFFISMQGYAVAAIMLVITGIYVGSINLSTQYLSGIEYSLSGSLWALAVVIPMLTMRSFVEERRLHTEPLLLCSPITAGEIVMGKYLAHLTVFLIPLGIIALYPLVFSAFGPVNFAAAYLSLLGVALVGAALVALGVLISSLTDNYVVSALSSLCVMLLMYFMSSLSSAATGSAVLTFIILTALVVALVALVYSATKSSAAAVSAGAVLELGIVILFFTAQSTLEAVLSDILSWLAVYDLSANFFLGILDISALVYYLSLSCLLLFFTVQSLEKKRWS